MNDINALRNDLRQLRGVFDIDSFLKQDIGPDTIRRYYTDCLWVYGLLHSPEGALHLALNLNGRFRRDGFYEQPRLVQQGAEAGRPACGHRRLSAAPFRGAG